MLVGLRISTMLAKYENPPEVEQFAPENLPSQKERLVFQLSFSGG